MMGNVYDKTEEDEVPLLEGSMRNGHSIFHCEICKTQRSYGYGKPELDRVMLLCQGTCHIHTWHKFIRIY